MLVLGLLSQLLALITAHNLTCHWSMGSERGQCTGDVCVAYIGMGITRNEVDPSANEVGQQHCLSGIPTLIGRYKGCYDMDGGAGWMCYCYTDLCNTIKVLDLPTIPLSPMQCFSKTKNECTGFTCQLTIDSQSRGKYCMTNAWATTFLNFFTNTVFGLIKDEYKEVPKNKQMTEVDYDFQCNKPNCSRILNHVVSTGFPSARPLITCALYPRDEQYVEQRRTCQGHFCLLEEHIFNTINETSLTRACLLVDETYSDIKFTSGVVALGYDTSYVCDQDYCNENIESTGFQKPIITLSDSSPSAMRWISFTIAPFLLMLFR